MWTKLFFFGSKKNQFIDFWIMWIPFTPMIPGGFWHFLGVMRMVYESQECWEDIQNRSTSEKHEFSMQNSSISPCGSRGWLGWNLGAKSMVLSHQRELSRQPVIKFNRNHPETTFPGCKSSPGQSATPWRCTNRKRSGFLIVHILY